MRHANVGASDAVYKDLAKRILQSVHLLKPLFRVHQRNLAERTRGNERPAPDGLPAPPAVLRLRVVGTGDFDWFLGGGSVPRQASAGNWCARAPPSKRWTGFWTSVAAAVG